MLVPPSGADARGQRPSGPSNVINHKACSVPFMMTQGGELPEIVTGMASCVSCGQLFMFCPECVASLPIDPQTGLPPDLAADGTPQQPDPAAVVRAERRPLCENCEGVIARRLGIERRAADRHREHQRWTDFGL